MHQVELPFGLTELIDTCWNVNEDVGGRRLKKWKELIDTCWNVNVFQMRSMKVSQPN